MVHQLPCTRPASIDDSRRPSSASAIPVLKKKNVSAPICSLRTIITNAVSSNSRRLVLQYTAALSAQVNQFPISGMDDAEQARMESAGNRMSPTPSTESTESPENTDTYDDEQSKDYTALEMDFLAHQCDDKMTASLGCNNALVERKKNDEGKGTTEHIMPNHKKTGRREISPPTKPRRPLSSYNLFFKHERARLLALAESGSSLDENPPQSLMTADIRRTLDNNPYHVDRDKRRHRKSHGKISFRDLTKRILENWKCIDPVSRSSFDELAKEHKDMYDREAAAYREWKSKEQLRARREARNARRVGKRKKNGYQQPLDDDETSERVHIQTQACAPSDGRNTRRRLSLPTTLPLSYVNSSSSDSISVQRFISIVPQNPHYQLVSSMLSEDPTDTLAPARAFADPRGPSASSHYSFLQNGQPEPLRSVMRRHSCPSNFVTADVIDFLNELDWNRI